MTVLYLHIGGNKSGSTAIQAFARENRSELARHGFHYPESGCNQHGAHHPLAFGFLDPNTASPMYLPTSGAADVREEVLESTTGSDRVLLSSEALFSATALDRAAIRAFLGHFERTVVLVYLRRSDSWFQALYKSRARAGDALQSFDEFCRVDFDYLHVLEFWEELAGSGNLVVRPFAKKAWRDEDLLSDFLGVLDPVLLGVDWATPTYGRHAAERLPVVDALIRLNHAGVTDRSWLLPLLRRATSDMEVDPDEGYLTHTLQAELLDRHSFSNERIAETYWSAKDRDAFMNQRVPAFAKAYRGLTAEQWTTVTTAIRDAGHPHEASVASRADARFDRGS